MRKTNSWLKSNELCILSRLINKIYKVQEKFILMNRTTNKTKPASNRSKKKKPNLRQKKPHEHTDTHAHIHPRFLLYVSDVSWKKNGCICILLLAFNHSSLFFVALLNCDDISKHTITKKKKRSAELKSEEQCAPEKTVHRFLFS
jgi:hypothetical protein